MACSRWRILKEGIYWEMSARWGSSWDLRYCLRIYTYISFALKLMVRLGIGEYQIPNNANPTRLQNRMIRGRIFNFGIIQKWDILKCRACFLIWFLSVLFFKFIFKDMKFMFINLVLNIIAGSPTMYYNNPYRFPCY